MIYCTKCAKQIDDDMLFCQKCGTSVNSANLNECTEIASDLSFAYNGLFIDLQKIISRHGANKIKAVQELVKKTKLPYGIAKKVIDEAHLGRVISVTAKDVQEANIRAYLLIFAWVFLLPIMAIIKIVRSTRLSKRLKTIFVSLIVIVCFVIATNHGNDSTAFSDNETPAQTNNQITQLSQEQSK